MLTQEHAQTALDFLEKADSYFEEGDQIQASEKLWGPRPSLFWLFRLNGSGPTPVIPR